MTYDIPALCFSAIFICGINQARADDTDDLMARSRLEASVVFDAKWLALREQCGGAAAPVSEDRLLSSWREANPKEWPKLGETFVREQIRKGIAEAASRYPSKPPQAICAMANELSSKKQADSSAATNKGGTANPTGGVYRCDADGTILFSDIKYKSMPCRALEQFNAAPAPAVKENAARALSIAEAKQIASYNLLDPEATRFRDLFVSKSGNVCGQLNAKNAYGAYTGYAPFVVLALTRRALIYAERESAPPRSVYRESCAK